MDRLILTACAGALLSGLRFGRRRPRPLPPARLRQNHPRRACRHRPQSASAHAVKARARADGHVTLWERAKIRVAEARHNALVYRLSHN